MTPSGDLNTEQRDFWLRAAGGLTPGIEAVLGRIRDHAAVAGFDPSRAVVTYEDHFGFGDIFNARVIRFRVPRTDSDVRRRYTIHAFTYEDTWRNSLCWQDEALAAEDDRRHLAFLGVLNDWSDECMVEVFGAGNVPNREYLAQRPQELEFRVDDWPVPPPGS